MTDPRVLIVGAGMSGICAAIKLRQAGFENFEILEKAGAVGGTWRENTYPGLTCDVPSAYYSFSFEPNPGWSHQFSPGGEIREYFERSAKRHGVFDRIRFGTEVSEARWEDEGWVVEASDGEARRCDVLICAAGVLHHPRYPQIEGLDDFAGAAFHSARWDHSVELEGKRIGVIGTGSTGVQIVTALAGVAGHLTMFQRTAQWVLPVPNRELGRISRAVMGRPRPARFNYRMNEWLIDQFGRATYEEGWRRRLFSGLCRLNLRRVKDPDLRGKLTPDYTPMCKRLVVSGDFYGAVQHPEVAVVDDRIERVEPGGVRTADGALHELDVLVLATGFDAKAFVRPVNLVGVDGVTLEDLWKPEPRAHNTVCLPGFPNVFMLMGPNSPIGNLSLVPIAERQAEYAIKWIELIARGEIAHAAPRMDALERFQAEIRAAMPGTVWTTGCDSWYLGADGVPILWPFGRERFEATLAEPQLDEFEVASTKLNGVRPA